MGDFASEALGTEEHMSTTDIAVRENIIRLWQVIDAMKDVLVGRYISDLLKYEFGKAANKHENARRRVESRLQDRSDRIKRLSGHRVALEKLIDELQITTPIDGVFVSSLVGWLDLQRDKNFELSVDDPIWGQNVLLATRHLEARVSGSDQNLQT